jgi:asparagine synthase (glutamine-hydrolysing)
MCGIAGCVTADGRRPDRGTLDALAAALGHRGPDDAGIEIVGNVGLVHTRLAIVDPSPAGHEPMQHAQSGWWLTYNGEVFNHTELRERLPDYRYRGGSDAETLLHALASWGEDSLAELNGLFAFAAIDEDAGRLLLVRDRFGVKPLYYARHDGGLWFASEIGALLAAGVPRRASPDVLLHAVRHGWANGEVTPVEGVRRLLPGSSISVDLRTLELTERAWYRPAQVVEERRMSQLAELAEDAIDERVEAALRGSVHARLMADVPVGTMCSGGLDSSLITALAAERKPDLVAFNASVVDDPGADEGPWAELVSDALGIELCTVRMDAVSWRSDLVGVVRHVEYPLNHESSVPMSQIAGLARRRGCKVLLSGEGADELFGGYPWASPKLTRRFQLRDRPVGRAARELLWTLRRLPSQAAARHIDPGGESEPVLAYERSVLDEALGFRTC